jgi:hypothetical protein
MATRLARQSPVNSIQINAFKSSQANAPARVNPRNELVPGRRLQLLRYHTLGSQLDDERLVVIGWAFGRRHVLGRVPGQRRDDGEGRGGGIVMMDGSGWLGM